MIELFFENVFNPFNVFQIFSVLLWFSNGYWKYAIVIAVTMLWEVIIEIRDIIESNQRINEMVSNKSKIEVFRNLKIKNDKMSTSINLSNHMLDNTHVNHDLINNMDDNNANLNNSKINHGIPVKFRLDANLHCDIVDSD